VRSTDEVTQLGREVRLLDEAVVERLQQVAGLRQDGVEVVDHDARTDDGRRGYLLHLRGEGADRVDVGSGF
jgi:hypothetical protein